MSRTSGFTPGFVLSLSPHPQVSVPGAVLGGALGAALLVYGLRGERGAGSAGKA